MRKKLQRFKDNAANNNVIEEGKRLYTTIKGHWRTDYFQNKNPITLELGCGYGEYTIQLATLCPTKNYIGIDLKGARLWKGSTLALEQQLQHVGFLRTRIEHLERFFSPGEVQEIYLPCPDPRPKKSDINKRLTSPLFLDIYRRILSPGAWLYFKTDDLDLFHYTLEVLQTQPDVQGLFYTQDCYQDANILSEATSIQTKYEMKFINQGKTIKYIHCQLGSA